MRKDFVSAALLLSLYACVHCAPVSSKLEVLLSQPRLAGANEALGVDIMQFPDAMGQWNNTLVAMAATTADGYSDNYGIMMYSTDSHGYEWATPTGNAGMSMDAANWFFPLDDGLLSVPSRTYHTDFGTNWDKRSFYVTATKWKFDANGAPYNDMLSFQKLMFTGAPTDISTLIGAQPFSLRGEITLLQSNGDVVDISKVGQSSGTRWKWFKTVFVQLDTIDTKLWAYVSQDGLNWQFQGVVASNTHHQYAAADGPSEATSIVLPDGRLQCMFRISGGSQPVWQSFSEDLGKTWSFGEPVYSAGNGTVLPKGLTLKNGVTLLTSGRPGIWMYASVTPEDPASWVPFDIAGNHDRQIANKSLVFGASNACCDVPHCGCSGYTSIVPTSDSTALLCYDQGIAAESFIWCVEAFTTPT